MNFTRLSLPSTTNSLSGCCIRKGLHLTTAQFQNANKSYANRQVKIFQKLLGTKKSGSKKRWIGYQDEHHPHTYTAQSILATPSNISRTIKEGKNANRRIAVLNKLFMVHITDLMATGTASEEIIGRGVEISRVKVTPDFLGVNVYWVSKGSAIDDQIIEKILHKCSGIIRHELSQLRLMGEVPRIRFVKDRKYANLIEVESLLRTCDFGDDHQSYDISEQTKSELNLESYKYTEIVDEHQEETSNDSNYDALPTMRHDVLGLNHKDIMDKILTKMKKSKQAWDQYDQQNSNSSQVPMQGTGREIVTMQQKLEANKLKEEEFEKFLQKRKFGKKNTLADRKKHLKYHELELDNNQDFDDENHYRKEDDGDYIEETTENTKF